ELVSLMRRYLRGEPATGTERVAVTPAAIVEEVVELLRPTLPRGVELSLSLDATCTVLAEPVHVHQIVLNLLTNAVQALTGRAAGHRPTAGGRGAHRGSAERRGRSGPGAAGGRKLIAVGGRGV